MKFVNALRRPEYRQRPTQILRRFAYALRKPRGRVWVRMPWGMPLLVQAEELHGRTMLTLGICDLRVSELLWRLIEPGDRLADIGANVGTMTALMAHRVGADGLVSAFEPHPVTRAILQESVECWQATARIEVLPYAVSGRAGTARLVEPEGFGANSGIAKIGAETGTGSGHDIETVRLDAHFGAEARFKLVKIDVEGHEDAVIEGMTEMLAAGRIDHVIAEEFRPLPSPLCDRLAGFGYACFLIERDNGGPRLVPVAERPAQLQGEPTNILATRDPDLVAARIAPRGWHCLA